MTNPIIQKSDRPVCSVDGCENLLRARGWCPTHWTRWRHHGDPLKGGTSPGAPMQWIQDHVNYKGDDCIKWPFGTSSNGYGIVGYKGALISASRVMCLIAHGEPSHKKMDAAHECGNGHLACMNKNHLSWKTRKENVQDSIRHGTWTRGENHPDAKLTEKGVLEIRMMGGTMSNRAISKLYGVTPSAVSAVLRRKSWAWLE